jgi:hypothetical protein
LTGALVGGSATALVGTLVAKAFPSERWVPVRLARVHVVVAPVRGRGVGVSVSVGF